MIAQRKAAVPFSAAILTLACLSLAVHAAPTITNVSVRGLQIGGTTAVTITGSDLLPAPQLMIGVPIAEMKVIEASTASSLQLQVTLGDKVTPGLYNLRVANEMGISGNTIVAVDRLPEAALAERIESTPIAVHGAIGGSNIARTTFAGQAGQELVVEVESQRLGGKLRPVLHLYDANRRQVALAMPAPWLNGDARMLAKLPADGDYTIELHDLHYAVPAPGYYRLKVGAFEYADLAFPPAIQRGQKATVSLIGNVPAENQVEIATATDNTPVAAPWPQVANASGWRPAVLISDFPELVEAPVTETPQPLPSIPVAVSGRLDAAGQEDVYRVAVTEGKKLRFEVFADRLGSPMDAVLEIRNDKGARLGLNDDFSKTTDPRLDYTVAKNVNTIDIAIRDQVDRADRRCIYRLVVTPLDNVPAGFRLKVVEDTHNVRQSGIKVFQVIAERQGYDGPIRLSLDNLPSSVTVSGAGIPHGSNGTLVTLTAVGQTASSVVTSIRGTSVAIDPPITSVAVFDKYPLGDRQPWMQGQVAMSLSPANSVPFQIQWNPTADPKLALGTKFEAPIKLVRPPGAIGPVRLSLVTSEPAPLVNGNPNVNVIVRAERPTVDIAMDVKAKAATDALAAADKVLTAAQAKLKTTSETNAKTVAAAQQTVKAATDKKTAATQTLAAAEARRKAAAAKQEEAKDELAAAEEAVKTATAALAATTAQLAAAENVLADTTAKTQASLAVASAAVKDAETKRTAAAKALSDAEAAIKNEVKFNVIVPPTLANSSQDLAIKAELRSVDNKTVLAEVFTPVRRFEPIHPLGLQLPGDPVFVAKLDAKTGATVKIAGSIERLAGFAGDVTVSITGQPAGVAVPKVVVKPDQKDFALELKFPANFKPAQVETIKLFATGPPSPAAKNIVVRTEIPIAVHILAADPPQK